MLKFGLSGPGPADLRKTRPGPDPAGHGPARCTGLGSCLVDSAFTTASFIIQLGVHAAAVFNETSGQRVNHSCLARRHAPRIFRHIINGPVTADYSRNLALLALYMFVLYTTALYAAVPVICRYAVVCAGAFPPIVSLEVHTALRSTM